jgi:membrane associated rhomboid family serine protease
MGALETSKVTKDHEGWRLITCIWLHAGVVHILANMLSLLMIGIRLEKEFGFSRCPCLVQLKKVSVIVFFFLGKQILHLCTMHLYYLESDGYFKSW